MRKILAAAALVAGMGLAASVQAAETLTFNITDIDVTVTNGPGFCLGCSVTATTLSPPATFALGANQSNSFQFVDFDLSGLGAGSATIDAKLTFDSPISGSAESGGSAHYVELFGLLTAGSLTWTAIPTSASPDGTSFTTANGSTFDVSFEDLKGLKGGGNVADYVTITAHNVVPEPATWALMIGGFGMAGAMLRRRRTAAAAA